MKLLKNIKNDKELKELLGTYLYGTNIKNIWDQYFKVKNLLDNPKRKQIYEIAQTKKLNIQEISDKIKLSYQNTFAHIKMLESFGLVKTKKEFERSIGRPRIVYKGKFTIEELEQNLYKALTTAVNAASSLINEGFK